MNSFKKAKVLKVVPKGRNFAKSGHTVHRHMCKEKAHDFRPACYVDGVSPISAKQVDMTWDWA